MRIFTPLDQSANHTADPFAYRYSRNRKRFCTTQKTRGKLPGPVPVSQRKVSILHGFPQQGDLQMFWLW